MPIFLKFILNLFKFDPKFSIFPIFRVYRNCKPWAWGQILNNGISLDPEFWDNNIYNFVKFSGANWCPLDAPPNLFS